MGNRFRKMSEEASSLTQGRDLGSLKVLLDDMEKRNLTVYKLRSYQ